MADRLCQTSAKRVPAQMHPLNNTRVLLKSMIKIRRHVWGEEKRRGFLYYKITMDSIKFLMMEKRSVCLIISIAYTKCFSTSTVILITLVNLRQYGRKGIQFTAQPKR